MALTFIGASAGGVKLLVAADDAAAAESILANRVPQVEQAEGEASGPWTCQQCFSEVDAGFDICWKCGAQRGSKLEASPGPSFEVSAAETLGASNAEVQDNLAEVDVDQPASRRYGNVIIALYIVAFLFLLWLLRQAQ